MIEIEEEMMPETESLEFLEPEGWKMIESPEMPLVESPIELPLYQPEMPLMESPGMEEVGYSYQGEPYPVGYYTTYGCGCAQDCGCGGSGSNQMVAPVFYGNHCNCNSFMHPMSYQMMPMPIHGHGWYGGY